ncbi:MAG TPA: hypothetical protein VIX14_08855 [Terriglobales bacterium]
MNRKTLFAALACALLVFSMLGCGITNKLQSIQLSTSNTVANAGTGVVLFGQGGTSNVYVWGNYSDGKQKLLNTVGGVAFQIVLTPGSVAETGQLGDPNATPPQTVQLSSIGLLTAVTPVACTFANVAAPTAAAPSFVSTGSYTLTATFSGFTTPPAYIGLASAAGVVSTSNPSGFCYVVPTAG